MKSKYFIIKNEKFIEKNNFNHKAIIIFINVICIKSLLLICFIVVLLRYDIYKYISFKPFKNKKTIFTFWEPRDKIPGYLNLCIKTWKKFLPEYEIKILDYNITKEMIGETLFSNIICKSMPLPLQADAIRVALLQKYGGIWMDTDTIVLNGNFFEQFQNFDLGMIGDEKQKNQYIGVIFGSNNSKLLKDWLAKIINNVKYYKYALFNKNKSNINDYSLKKAKSYFLLGYDIIVPLLKNKKGKQYFRLDFNKINPFPERIYFCNSSLNFTQQYNLFYFQKGDPEFVLNNSKDLILLHNSWTPLKFKNMSEKEFLKEDILLSKLLSKILNYTTY